MDNYKQLCVWAGTTLGESDSQGLVDFFQENFNTRIKFGDEVVTNPDIDSYGNEIENTGGRSDLLFYVHNDDISHFATSRFEIGVRWWEDVVSYNEGSYLYSKEILEKYPVTW